MHKPQTCNDNYEAVARRNISKKQSENIFKIFMTSLVQMFDLQTPQTLNQWIISYIDKIKIIFEAISRETVASASFRFRSWIEAVIDGNGSFMSKT